MSAEVAHACPWCGRAHDRTTALDEADVAPRVGDVGFCFDCGRVFFFGKHGTRRPTPIETLAIGSNPEFLAVRAAWERQRS